MRAMVYEGGGQRAWVEVADPKMIDDTDVIVRIETTTICGTDLHILKGDVAEVTPGRILGHEAVGTVIETGLAVRSLREGDRVLVSAITSCGLCDTCRSGRYGQCRNGGGWQLGHTIDGVQAEYARIPFADFSCYRLPDEIVNEQAVLLADVLPTGFEVGVRNGNVQPGDVVAVVGAGPVGLAAVVGARLSGAGVVVAIDPKPARLQAAKKVGADAVGMLNEVYDVLDAVTGDEKVDVVIEAVGTPQAFELCMSLVRPGGRVANVGVHGKPALLHLESLWASDITITTGLVDTNSIPMLMGLMRRGRLDAIEFVSHHFLLDQAPAAYDMFSDADRYEALKVVMNRG